MKKVLLVFIVIIFTGCLFAQSYSPVDDSSEVKFSIKNFGLSVSGSFTGLRGKIIFNQADLPASSISAVVNTSTINTGNEARDRHLKKEEYFDIGKYPLISFVSARISNSTKPDVLFMEGKITIKDITRAISFPFTVTPRPDGYLYEGTFKLNRRDFGVGGSSMVMSDSLSVSLSVFAKKQN